MLCRSFRSSQSCYLSAWGCTWQQREGIICPLHPSWTGKAILDVSCSKRKELSNRDDNDVRMRVSGEDAVSPSPGQDGSATGWKNGGGDLWSPPSPGTHTSAHTKDVMMKSFCCSLRLLTHKFPPSDPTSSIHFWQENAYFGKKFKKKEEKPSVCSP